MSGLAAWFSSRRPGCVSRWGALYLAFRRMPLRYGAFSGILLLAGCAQPNPLVKSMDDFFDRLDAPQAPADPGIITGPGYAPAYPPYDVRSGDTSSAR